VSSRLASLLLCCLVLGSCGTSTVAGADASRRLLDGLITHSDSVAVNKGTTFKTQVSIDAVAPTRLPIPLDLIAIPGFKVIERWHDEINVMDMQLGQFHSNGGVMFCHLSIDRLDQAHTVIALAGFDVPRMPLAVQDAFKRVKGGEAQYVGFAADCRSKAWSPRA
jgi:hypothetical protein